MSCRRARDTVHVEVVALVRFQRISPDNSLFLEVVSTPSQVLKIKMLVMFTGKQVAANHEKAVIPFGLTLRV